MSDKEINSRFIKLSGKAEIPEPLELGRNYHIALDATITAVTEHDNNNGTKDIAYKVEPILCEILKDSGETIKAKDTRKDSQKTRNVLYAIWMGNNNSEPFEDFYHKFQVAIRTNADEIITKFLTSL